MSCTGGCTYLVLEALLAKTKIKMSNNAYKEDNYCKKFKNTHFLTLMLVGFKCLPYLITYKEDVWFLCYFLFPLYKFSREHFTSLGGSYGHFVPCFILKIPLLFSIHKEAPGILCLWISLFFRNKVPPICII